MKQRFENPVYPHGADPWVVRDADSGRYYYCFSGGNGVYVNEISSPAAITPEGGTKVYTAPADTVYSKEYWAPELHKIGGKWYIYVAADDGNNDNHRMYVLACTGENPTEPFEMCGRLADAEDRWAIDGTVMLCGGECYFVWSGWDGDVNVSQNIYIAHMSDPCTIDSRRVLISKPDLEWERLGGRPCINEGPVALRHGDTVHIIYSASGSWSDYYCLGMLTLRGDNPLDASDWVKSAHPVLEKTDSVFGPGHCSFTEDGDGNTWVVYHANLVSGTGWRGRSVWLSPVSWDGDRPVFSSPESGESFEFPCAE